MNGFKTFLVVLWLMPGVTTWLNAQTPGSPSPVPAGPASGLAPSGSLDPVTRSNLLNMNALQRRMFLLTNQAFRSSPATPANPPAAAPPPASPATPNVSEAILPSGTPSVPRSATPATPGPASRAATPPSAATPGTASPTAPAAPATPGVTRPAPTTPAGAAAPPGATAPPGAAPGPARPATPVAAGASPANTNLIISGSEEDIIPAGMIRLTEADLGQVLDYYAELTGRTILRPANLPAAKINLRNVTPLTRREGIQALESVLALNQITTVPMEDKFVKVLPSANAGNAGGKPVTSPEKIVEFGPFTTHIVQLKHVDPTELVSVLQPFSQLPNSIVAIKSSQILVLRDYAENIKRMLDVIEKVDVVVPALYEPVVIPIRYALASDIQQVLGSLSAGGGGGITVGGSSAGAGSRAGGVRGGTMGGSTMGRGTSGIGGYQSGIYSGMNPGISPMAGPTTPAAGNLAQARSAFANRLSGIIRSSTQGAGGDDIQVIGMAKIIADERTNSLLVFADKTDMQTITNIIAKLDVVLAQVLIEGVVAEVSVGDSETLGVSMQQKRPTTAGDFTGIGALNPVKLGENGFFRSVGTNGVSMAEGLTYYAQVGEDLEVLIRALASDRRAQIIQRPRILTSHAKEASIFVGQTRPYITGYTAGGGYYGNYSQYQQLQIGINLSILPFINSEGLVVMDIQQRIQGIRGFVTINGNEVPVTSDKEATAYIAVRDRDTVMLGGYIDADISSSHEGVPWLKDIPLIGALFKTHKSDSSRSELVIMVRPTVLSTPEAAAMTTAQERDAMPGIRHAEAEYDAQTRSEMEKAKALEASRAEKERKQAEKDARKVRSGSVKRGS